MAGSKSLMFSTVQDSSVQYTDFNTSHDVKLSLNAGSVVPVLCRECLPGDTYDLDISSFVRMSPMSYPVMHNIQVFFHTFFVPNRLVYRQWDKFIWQGEGKVPLRTSLPLTDIQLPSFTIGRLFSAISKLTYPPETADPEEFISWLVFGSKLVTKTPTLSFFIEWFSKQVFNSTELVTSYTSLFDYLGLQFTVDEYYVAHCRTLSAAKTLDEWYEKNETPTITYKEFLTDFTNANPGSALFYKLEYDTLQQDKAKSPQIYNKILYRYFIKPTQIATQSINALPFRAYNLIWDSYYRYEAISSAPEWDNIDISDEELLRYCLCLPRAYEHDYFTSCLPTRQKGQALALPVSEIQALGSTQNTNPTEPISSLSGNGTSITAGNGNISLINKATALVNDLRTAIKLQSFNELFARVGSRVNEALKGIFNVDSEDGRLDIPAYISGSNFSMQISEVVQTSSSTDSSALGDYAGHGIGSDRGDHIHYTTNEHGFLFVMMSIRPQSEYADNVSKMWFRHSYLDYAWPQLATLGEQEVLNKELSYFADINQEDPVSEKTFGYIPRYSEYKYAFDRLAGDFRDQGTFFDWTLARRFMHQPNLNANFIYIDPHNTNRIFSYTEEDYDHYYAQVHFDMTSRLPLPLYSDPTF